MRIGVMGAGAVGSYFGAKLAVAGEDTVFVARGAHLAAMRAGGLSVRSIGGDFHLAVRAVGDPTEAGPCDLVLFAVKAYDTGDAIRAMAPMVGPGTTILPLQNGIESEERLAEAYGAERVLGGLCYVGARIEKPGEVIHSAAGRVILGGLGGSRSTRAETAAQTFRRGGVPVEVSADIRADKWKKFCWNLSFNAVSALTRGRVGQILDDAPCRAVVRAVIAEAVAVARTRGVEMGEDFPDRVIRDNEPYRDLKTSMLQDVEKGRRIEADALNGGLCRVARAAGVATPVNDTLHGLLSGLDRTLGG